MSETNIFAEKETFLDGIEKAKADEARTYARKKEKRKGCELAARLLDEALTSGDEKFTRAALEIIDEVYNFDHAGRACNKSDEIELDISKELATGTEG